MKRIIMSIAIVLALVGALAVSTSPAQAASTNGNWVTVPQTGRYQFKVTDTSGSRTVEFGNLVNSRSFLVVTPTGSSCMPKPAFGTMTAPSYWTLLESWIIEYHPSVSGCPNVPLTDSSSIVTVYRIGAHTARNCYAPYGQSYPYINVLYKC